MIYISMVTAVMLRNKKNVSPLPVLVTVISCVSWDLR